MRKTLPTITLTALLLTGCTTTEEPPTDDTIIPTEAQAQDLCDKAAQAHQNARIDTWTKAARRTDNNFNYPTDFAEETNTHFINGDYYADAGTWDATCSVYPGEDGNLPYASINVWNLNVGGNVIH